MTVGTFTLMIWLYVGGGRHQTFYINRLTKADCEALAWEVGRVEMNADTDCHRSGDPIQAPTGDYYYWFTSDVVVVDNTWVDYVP